ncbi:MAG: bifunctional ornithine acetyltransferase/N-acetylglutamate synthase, partial [Rhodocyclaceae bacterium]|nr:bifunctional ornithine acetyltransferase/N-acetylglutamate synthase [Rhodocyclaceae bacterium]MCA3042836.1 bifunctional ornithine acetyltransferase/N-acetylglutamate synthase [Rhodocyclaceae bacterium]MCA3058120.1 bifunctional ornithine acetyltransferase/N-acetylglutamate synthase [Rhodocyclaceae bacterium]
MAVNYTPPTRESLLPVPGLRLGYAEAYVRKPNRKDMLIAVLDEG